MNWRKSITYSFLPLIAFLAFILMDKKSEVKETKRSLASESMKPNYNKKKIVDPQVIAAFKGKENQNVVLRNRIPQSVESTFEKDFSVKVTRGYELLRDVAAIKKKEFNSDMGEVIQEHDGFVFFRTNPDHPYSPVAISKNTNTLFPVASILHIKGATPELRSQVINQGYKEYYYHAPMKFLSIKSDPANVLRMYSELNQKGFRVELEVLKPKHQIN